jgi:hypothetical protein
MRGSLVAACVLVGAALAPVGNVLVWADRDLADRARFTELGVEALRDPAAADAIATEAVRRLRRRPILRAVLDPERTRVALARLLRRPAAGALEEQVAVDAYEIIVRGRRAELTADLTPLYEDILATLSEPDDAGARQSGERGRQAAGPLAQGLSPEPPAALRNVLLAKRGELPDLHADPGTTSWLGPLVAGLAAALLIIGVALASRRGAALIAAGLLVALGAFAVLLALDPLVASIVRGVPDTSARIITQEALERLEDGLATQSWVVAGVGLAAACLGAVLSVARR